MRNDASNDSGLAILVLGAKVALDGTPSLLIQMRIRQAAISFNEFYERQPKIILSGRPHEVAYMKVALREMLMPFSKATSVLAYSVIEDNASMTTEESATNIAALLIKHAIRRAILVTDNIHRYRQEILLRLATHNRWDLSVVVFPDYLPELIRRGKYGAFVWVFIREGLAWTKLLLMWPLLLRKKRE